MKIGASLRAEIERLRADMSEVMDELEEVLQEYTDSDDSDEREAFGDEIENALNSVQLIASELEVIRAKLDV